MTGCARREVSDTNQAAELPSSAHWRAPTACNVTAFNSPARPMRLALIAHDGKKDAMIALAGDYLPLLRLAAGAAADQTGTGAGGVLLLGGNQVPFCVFAGHAIAFITEAGASGITYTVLP